jgi:hypothetical protein
MTHMIELFLVTFTTLYFVATKISEKQIKLARIAAAVLVALAFAGIASAQTVHTISGSVVQEVPMTVFAIGSSLDLVTTLHALSTVPGAHEANPLLSHGGTAGLIAGKTISTVGILWVMHRLAKAGHPTAARVIGYTGGAVLSGIAWRNTRVGRE